MDLFDTFFNTDIKLSDLSEVPKWLKSYIFDLNEYDKKDENYKYKMMVMDNYEDIVEIMKSPETNYLMQENELFNAYFERSEKFPNLKIKRIINTLNDSFNSKLKGFNYGSKSEKEKLEIVNSIIKKYYEHHFHRYLVLWTESLTEIMLMKGMYEKTQYKKTQKADYETVEFIYSANVWLNIEEKTIFINKIQNHNYKSEKEEYWHEYFDIKKILVARIMVTRKWHGNLEEFYFDVKNMTWIGEFNNTKKLADTISFQLKALQELGYIHGDVELRNIIFKKISENTFRFSLIDYGKSVKTSLLIDPELVSEGMHYNYYKFLLLESSDSKMKILSHIQLIDPRRETMIATNLNDTQNNILSIDPKFILQLAYYNDYLKNIKEKSMIEERKLLNFIAFINYEKESPFFFVESLALIDYKIFIHIYFYYRINSGLIFSEQGELFTVSPSLFHPFFYHCTKKLFCSNVISNYFSRGYFYILSIIKHKAEKPTFPYKKETELYLEIKDVKEDYELMSKMVYKQKQ